MFKKGMFALIVLAISSCAFAEGAPYFGLNVAVNSGSVQLSNAGVTSNFSAKGESGGVLVGFGADLENNLHVAAEIFGNDTTANTITKVINLAGTTAKIKPSYSYGASLLPGIRLGADTMLFLRIGGVRGRFDLTQTFGSAQQTSSTIANGAEVGAGAQLALSNNLSLRGEYNYINYSSFRSLGSSIHSHNNQLSMALLYRFL